MRDTRGNDALASAHRNDDDVARSLCKCAAGSHERAHKLAPADPFILDSMGWALYRLGRLDEAEEYLVRAFAERPDPEIAAHLGEVLFARGQPQKAREIWQSQLKTSPDHPLLLETMRRHSR